MPTLDYLPPEHREHPDVDPEVLDDETLGTLARQVRATLSPPPPAREFELDRLREFLALTAEVAIEAGVDSRAELEEVLTQAAQTYVARSVQDHLADVFRLTFELPAPPVTRGAAAFFRRFAER